MTGKQTNAPLYPTHNTLPEEIRENSIVLLNKHLAAAIDLQGQLKQAHWNVRGHGFIAVHELFDKVVDVAADAADDMAERCAALGGTAAGTVQVAAAQSFLVPYPLQIADVQKHIFAVSAALAAFGQSVRGATDAATKAGDADTADLFTQISRAIDHQLWFVEAHATVK
jgi:starvation-inducible DNA-binding protein